MTHRSQTFQIKGVESHQETKKLDEHLYNIAGITAGETFEEGLHDEPFDVFMSFLSFASGCMHAGSETRSTLASDG